MNDEPRDNTPGRKGNWMHCSLGGRFFPEDPRAEEVFISDIANGLALDCRYAGQGRVDRYYSVAEHCVHVSKYLQRFWGPRVALVGLLHDAAEAYINDLARPTKIAVGSAYEDIEDAVQKVIYEKYIGQCHDVWFPRGSKDRVAPMVFVSTCAEVVKDVDRRIVAMEKEAIMRHPQPWSFDRYKRLEDIEIKCWSPDIAKWQWLLQYKDLATEMNMEVEKFEL